jgi:serine/threonine protein kinase
LEYQRWQRLERLFEAAEPLPPAERSAFLDAVFAEDPDRELRQELEEMLRTDLGSGSSGVAVAIAEGLQVWAENEKPPSHLGPYRIRREIGRGGMATVYEAERDDQEFERKVAVKVIRRGMDSADIVRRLRRERQILANLDHPNIARLLDGGTTQDGRPYVVMEHIAGEPIDRYCLRQGLGLEERLRLFRQICDAVHFAHRNLVLHRDIKPSNILVTSEGVPKLLDFGIAKVVEGGREPDSTEEHTRTGLRYLTPEWASPEQVRGEPLTTASDVYSLGLLLYWLVAGRRAYEVDPKRPTEMERIVCEVDPPPPRRSGQQTSGFQRLARRWAPGLLSPADDLDVVVMVALRKDPARRYASAEQLSEDLRRFLENLPIDARKDSFGYRTGVFVRRHRLAVLFAAITFVTLLTTALVAIGQARVARDERQRAEENLQLAEEQRRRAEQVAELLVDIFEVSDPGEARGRTLTAREVLDQGAQRMRSSLKSDPDLRADLLGTIGRVYQKLALYDDAEALIEEATRLRQSLDAGGPKTAASLRSLAQLALDRGHYEKAEKLGREALALFQAGNPPERLEIARCLLLIAEVEIELDRLAEAEARFGEVLAIQEELLGPDAEEVSQTRNRMGELHYRRGSFEAARATFDNLLETRRRVLGDDHPELALALNNLAAAELRLRRFGEAEDHLHEVLAIRRRIFGEVHDQVASALNNLAAVQSERNDLKAAIGNAGAALAIYRQVLGPEHPRVADSLHNLGNFHQILGRYDEAVRFYDEALDLRRRIYGSDSPAVAQTLRNLGDLYLEMESDPERAEGYYLEALSIDRRALPPNDYRLAISLVGLGRLALVRDTPEEAEKYLREAVTIRRLRMPADWRRAEAEGLLGYTLLQLAPGNAEGRRLLESSIADHENELGADHPKTRKMTALLEQARGLNPR